MAAPTYAPLRIPAYRWYLASLLCITLGIQVQAAALFWQIFHLTHDELSLGLIGLAEALPALGVALYAGVVADRHDRRLVALGALAALVACSATLLLLTRAEPSARLQWAIYGIVAASGFARSFLGPARSALGAELVPRELYAASVSLRSGTWQLGLVCGPALGGALIAAADGVLTLAYAVDAALMLVGIGCMLVVRRVPPPRAPAGEPLLKSLGGGIAFVWADRALLAAMALDLFAVLFGGAMALLPAFCAQVLSAGPGEYGWLRAAPSIGAVVMLLPLSVLPPIRYAGPVMLAAVALFGGCWIAFACSTAFALSLGLLVLSGAADYVSVVVRHTLVQTRTPQALLGRVSSVNAMFIGSSNEIGAFESGVAAKWLGLKPSVIVGGIITIGVVAAIAVFSPQLRRLRRLDEPGEQAKADDPARPENLATAEDAAP
jgi:MFS family permease